MLNVLSEALLWAENLAAQNAFVCSHRAEVVISPPCSSSKHWPPCCQAQSAYLCSSRWAAQKCRLCCFLVQIEQKLSLQFKKPSTRGKVSWCWERGALLGCLKSIFFFLIWISNQNILWKEKFRFLREYVNREEIPPCDMTLLSVAVPDSVPQWL